MHVRAKKVENARWRVVAVSRRGSDGGEMAREGKINLGQEREERDGVRRGMELAEFEGYNAGDRSCVSWQSQLEPLEWSEQSSYL